MMHVSEFSSRFQAIEQQASKVLLGQDDILRQTLIAIFAGGHCILEGVPGLAKTLLVQTVARSLSLNFGRIQFTPDLMPADITGTEVLHEDRQSGTREFKFVHGPIFANILLADDDSTDLLADAFLSRLQLGQGSQVRWCFVRHECHLICRVEVIAVM